VETRLGIGDEVITGAVPATVDFGGMTDWPEDVADCVAALGGPLPPLTPKGSPVTWSVSQNPEGLIQVDDLPKELDAGATAALTYQTGTESAKDAEGEEQTGSVRFDVTVDRPDLTQLRDTIANAAFSALPDAIEQIVGPILGPTVKDVLSGLIDLVDVTGTATITVIYHIPPEDEKPAEGDGGEQSSNPNEPCYIGAWVVEDFGDLWVDAYAAGGAATYDGASGSLGWAFRERVAVSSENGYEIYLTVTSDAGVSSVTLRLIGTFVGTYTATSTDVTIQWDGSQSPGSFTATVDTLGFVVEVDMTDLWLDTSGTYGYECGDDSVRLIPPTGGAIVPVKP